VYNSGDMKGTAAVLPLIIFALLASAYVGAQTSMSAPARAESAVPSIAGFRNSKAEVDIERRFLAVPDPKLAERHLRALTAAPHLASTPEDRATADYVADRFRAAGLETSILEYRVWMNLPAEISVDVVAPTNVHMHGPSPERVDGDPYQDDLRISIPFNESSPSADLEADVVYANYGRPDDIARLEQMGVDVHGKLLLARYGQGYRGV
jgi:N-acetylated-alpha-linked acidic dipeptidase